MAANLDKQIRYSQENPVGGLGFGYGIDLGCKQNTQPDTAIVLTESTESCEMGETD